MDVILENIKRQQAIKHIKESAVKKYLKKDRIMYIYSVALKLSELYYIETPIKPELICELTDLMVFQYLLLWLENDDTCSQGILEFLSHRYTPKTSSEYVKKEPSLDAQYTGSNKNSKKTRMYDALVIYNSNIEFQQKNKILNGYMHKDIAPDSNTKKHNFLKLAFLDMYTEDYLEVYELLLLRNNKLEIENRAKDNDELVTAYENLDKFFHKIKNTKSNREFVVLNMLYYKLEYIYRFNFVRELAIYLKDNKFSEHTSIPNNLLNIIFNCEIPFYKNGEKSFLICPSPFIHNYEEVIQKCFLHTYLASTDERTDELLYIRKIRDIYNDIYVALVNLLPTKELGSWTDSDFSNAKNFIKKRFSSSLYLNSRDISKTQKRIRSYTDYIRSIYYNPYFFDQTLWNETRYYLKSKLKDYNKKQHKKQTK